VLFAIESSVKYPFALFVVVAYFLLSLSDRQHELSVVSSVVTSLLSSCEIFEAVRMMTRQVTSSNLNP